MTTQNFYRMVTEETGQTNREAVKRGTAAVLRALRDRLTPDEARQAAAQLPRELKRIWAEGDAPGRRRRGSIPTEGHAHDRARFKGRRTPSLFIDMTGPPRPRPEGGGLIRRLREILWTIVGLLCLVALRVRPWPAEQ